MKTLRALYLVTAYIVIIPMFTIVGIGLYAWLCIQNIILTGSPYFKDMFESGVEGVKIGHKCNMLWVKYGKNYEWDDLVREFGG